MSADRATSETCYEPTILSSPRGGHPLSSDLLHPGVMSIDHLFTCERMLVLGDRGDGGEQRSVPHKCAKSIMFPGNEFTRSRP